MKSILPFRAGRAGGSWRLPSGWGALLCGLLLAFGPQAQAQRGKNGAGTITAINTAVNTYTTLTANATVGATTLSVAASGLTGNGFTAPLTTGDLIMIIQMQGATINTTNTVSYGAVTNNNAGNFELSEVRSVPSSTSIEVACGLQKAYTSAGRVQIVRIPRYTTLTLNANTSIVPPAWNGSTGGIVAIDVQGDVIMNTGSSINATGRGFRGGALNNSPTAVNGATGYLYTTNANGAEKGESIAGYQADYDNLGGRFGRGAPANGGGGGNNHNASGGGGANVSGTAWTGQGNPDNSSTYATAWNLEGNNFSASTSGGGGRGGYSYSNTQNNPNTTAPGNTAWGGDNRRNTGGLGGRPLDQTGGRLFFGGGGGAGDANDNVGTAGANGGGLIFVQTGGRIARATNTTTNITIVADGNSVTSAATNDGSGGGGGGGTIILNAASTVSNTLAVSAVGGQGGSQNIGGNEAEGPGGGGGGGLIAYTDPPLSATTAGGANGTTNSGGVNNVGTNPAVSFPPDGATIGGAGVVGAFTYFQQCLVTADVQTVLSGPSTGTVGQPIIYTVQTVNLSPEVTATNVVPSITLPAGATNVVLPAGASIAGNVVTFATIASLAPNQNVTNTVRYTPAAAGTVTASDANTSGSPDPTVANNNGTAANATVSTLITVPSATACANPGANGPGVSASNLTNLTSLAANPMAYYPGTSATVNANATTFTVGAATGAGTAIASGDLLLIIQMQGADLNTDNTDLYGDGVPGLPGNGVLSNANYVAGQYEYATAAAATPASGGTVTLSTGLRNSYSNATGTIALAQKRFQVVRVPQYGNLTLGTDITVTPWDGTSGGVFAVDVAGTLNFNGKIINANGAGFRGGANVDIAIGGAGASSASEYVLNSNLTAQKGEGTAGTPALVNIGGTATSTGSTYVNGSAGRGAPGTAGGSGIRSANGNGFENSGGAGGANAGAGGRGGNNYAQNIAIGGEPGAAFTVFSPSRLVLGGGGGGGDSNNNVGTSGAAGGGLVLVRAGNATGTGTVSADGASAASGQNDAAGGGGAGGSVLLTVDRGNLSSVTVTAQGGNGGSAVFATPHGPGGGGGGGVVFANAALAASNVSGGSNGTTGDGNASSGNAFGAAAGLGGAGPTGSTGQGTFGPTTLSAPVNSSVAGATCNPAPVTQNDAGTTAPNTAVVFNGTGTNPAAILGNDSDVTGGLDATTVNLDPTSATPVRTRTITNVGTWTVNATTGVLTFTPVAGFIGVATLPYTVTDIYGKLSNQAVATVTVENSRSDLSTTITSNPASGGTVNAGALVPYSVTATNNTGTGLSAATGVVQTVQLQSGLTAAQLTITGSTSNSSAVVNGQTVITYAGGTFAGATYNQATGVLSFPPVSLALGASQTYTFSAAAPASGPFTVLAQVGNGNVDPTPANNTAGTTLSVAVKADLATTISGPTTNPTAGDLMTYNVTASNVGTSPATAAVQTVNIGTGRTNVYATNGGTYDTSNGLVTFPAIALAPGQIANNSVSFAAPAGGTVLSSVTTTFTAASLTTNNDTNTANDVATATSRTTQSGTGTPVNVSTTLTAISNSVNVSPGTVSAGATINYSAVATNNGPGSAASVQEVVVLPAGLTATQLAVTGSTSNSSAVVNGQTVITYAGGTFAGATYNQATGVLTFPGAGTLAPQGSATYTFSVTAPNTPTLLAVASVSTTSIDPVTGDNVASTLTTIGQGTDVSVQLLGPATATAGQPVSYVATAFNNGPNTATQVVETVTIAPGLLTSTTDNNGLKVNGSLPTSVDATTGVATYTGGTTYDPRTGVVTFPTLATLASGASAQNTLTYLAPATATVSNIAAVRSTSADTNPANNASPVTTTVAVASDIVVAVSGPATATTGDLVTYAVTTTNNGTSTATGASATALQAPTGLPVATSGNSLRVNGQYPASVSGTTGVATFADGSTYDPATGVVAFPTVSGQFTGTASAVTNTVSFSAPNATNLNLVATVNPAAGSADRNLDNNSASTSTQLVAPSAGSADLLVDITSNVATQTAGQFITFTVTPSNASTSAVAGSNVRTQVVVTAGQPTSGVNAIVVNNQSTPTSVNGTTGVATYADNSTYNPATGVVTFPTTTTLGVGITGTGYTVRIAAPGTGPLVAVASVRSDNAEDAALTANNVKSTPVAITGSADLRTVVSGPSQTAVGAPVAYTVTTTNLAPTTAGGAGGSPAVGATQTITVPANAATGTPTVTGPGTVAISGSAAAGFTITISYGTLNLGSAGEVANTVSFTEASTATYTVSATASTTGAGATADPVAGNNPSSQQTTIAPTGPVAADIVNNGRTGTNVGQSPIGNTAGPVAITSLASTAGSSAVATYNITAIPTVGTLYVNGVAVTAPRSGLTLLEATQLTYDPAATGAQGSTTPSTLAANNDFFQFTATDNNGLVSNVARYTVPVNQDNLSVYTTIVKGGNANTYANGDVVAYGIDPNGALYNASGLVYNANGTPATGTVKNGIQSGSISSADVTTLATVGIVYNTTTGLFTVSDATKLPRAGRTISVVVTTTDLLGGVTVQTVNLVLGNNPLPVELTDFTATAVKNVDAALLWHTASEKNNDHFDVERSLNGTDFVKIGLVKGQGSTSTATSYALTDAGIGRKAQGLVYYRLKQVDVDGTATYSPVRTVTFTATAATEPAISLFPNPATSATQLDLTALPTGTYQVSVLDATGRVVLSVTREAGVAQALDVNTIASGTYMVLVRGQHNGQLINLTKRLIKQ